MKQKQTKRPKIAFFDYPDVFEDFYSHYGVTQETFATWHNTANHGRLKLVQEEIGDITWFVACIRPQLKESVQAYVGCRIRFVSSSWAHRLLWRLFYKPRFAWRWRKYYRSFATIASYLALLSFSFFRTLKKEKPDLILVQDYCSGKFDVLVFFAGLLRIPIVTIHSGSTPEKYLGKYFKKFTIPKADWIFSSGGRESHLLLNTFKVPGNRLSIIRPPIDTSIYRPLQREQACSKMQLDPSKRYWLFTGRLDDDVKRISAIFNKFFLIAKKFPTIDFLVVGTGKDEAKLKQTAAELAGGRIHFLGWVAEDSQKAWIYNVAECLFLASWREASPAVIGEAFSCGVPVASSKVGGIDDLVIPNKSGWLFPAGDDEAMYTCFHDIASNPATLGKMRPVVRSIAEQMVSFDAIKTVLKKGFATVTNPVAHD